MKTLQADGQEASIRLSISPGPPVSQIPDLNYQLITPFTLLRHKLKHTGVLGSPEVSHLNKVNKN